MRNRALLMAAVLAAATTACEDTTVTPEGEGSVEGRIESIVVSPTMEGSAARAAGATRYVRTAQEVEATEVAVAQVGAGGSLEVLVDGVVEEAAYQVDSVPAGVRDLVVVARSAEGAEVGRALIHGETEADATQVVAPINAETTLEGTLLGALKAVHADDAARNTGGLVAFVRMSDAEAEAILASAVEQLALAHAYQASEAALTAAFDAQGVDMGAALRSDLTTPVALQYAIQRNDGASQDLAHEALVEGVITAYASTTGTTDPVALATATGVSAAAHATTDVEEATLVAAVRQALAMNLRARARLATGAAGFPGAAGVASALSGARVNLSTDQTMADLDADLAAVLPACRTAVLDAVLDLLSGYSLSIRNGVQAEILSAFQEADLAARLQGKTSAQAMAGVLEQYRSDVQDAAQQVATEVPAGVSFDALALVEVLLAAGSSPWIS